MTALWTQLEADKTLDIKKLQVLGDSKLVINWAHGKANLQNISLEPIMKDIKLAFQSFKWLSLHHILRELNSKANELSKNALELQNGTFLRYEFLNGMESVAVEHRI